MNYKKLGKLLGKIMILESILMLAPLGVSLIYKESFVHTLAFLVPIVILVVLAVRLLLRSSPKIYSYLLWSVVLFRLLCPLSISAKVSVLKPIPVTTSPGVSSVSYGFQQSIRGSSPAPSVSPEVRVAPVAERKAPAPMEMAAWVWLAGAAGMAVYGMGSYWKLKRRLSEAVPLDNNVYIADGISTPFVMGLVRPKIYLPVHTPEENQSFILAH